MKIAGGGIVRAALFLSLLTCAGCASIVDGSTQTLSVKATDSTGDVADASCKLSSNKGTWFVKTPGTVSVHRSYDPLNVKCDKDGYQSSVLAVKSSTKGMAFGNILFGGLIGAGVDMSTGAAYDYPDLITVRMAKLGEPPAQQDTKPTQPPAATTQATPAAKPSS